MALPHSYPGQLCSMSRTLEIVGERWTLLIVRDAFFGARRFGDFVTGLGIPRAVLTERLNALVETGVMARQATAGRREEYVLTDKGLTLWPVLRALTAWGDRYCAPAGPMRLFRHDTDSGLLDTDGRCAACGDLVGVENTVMEPGPGLDSVPAERRQLTTPHRLLDPVRP